MLYIISKAINLDKMERMWSMWLERKIIKDLARNVLK